MAEGIRFHYLYRDSGNYKKFGHRDFSNPNFLTIDEISQRIKEALIDSEFFYPDQVGIKKFLFHRYADDYSWYEFEKIEAIETKLEHEIIDDFLLKLKRN